MSRSSIAALLAVGAASSPLDSPAADAPHRPATGLVLADRGLSAFQIVLADDPSPAEVTAAALLAAYLARISDARLPIVSAGRAAPGPRMLVGARAAAALGRPLAGGRPVGEELVVAVQGRDVIVAGGVPRATIYAALSLLERLGCRFFTPEITHIPRRSRVVLAAPGWREGPAFEYRESFYGHGRGAPEWALRLRNNGTFAGLGAVHGGGIVYHHFVHTFGDLVPPDVFATHPEFFAEIDGARRSGQAQLCLTSAGARRAAARTVRAWIAEKPDAAVYSVSQLDTSPRCTCAQCRKAEAEAGAASGPLLAFVNEVAEDVAGVDAGKLVDTLAYQWSEAPPRTVRPRPNVRVRLCAGEQCQLHPYEGCERNRTSQFLEHLRGWARLTDQLWIWHYAALFREYLVPLPNLDEIPADLLLYRKTGVRGAFVQGNYDGGRGNFLDDLRVYVLHRLLWNPDQPPQVLVDEYLRGVYGPAAGAVRGIVDALHRTARAGRAHGHVVMDLAAAPWLSADVLEDVAGLLREARAAAAGDVELRDCIGHVGLSFEYVELARAIAATAGRALGDEARAALAGRIDRFEVECRHYGVRGIAEAVPVELRTREWRRALGITEADDS